MRRHRRLPAYKAQIEPLEARQLLSRRGATVLPFHALPAQPRPDLDQYAAQLVADPRRAAQRGLGALAADLHRHAGQAAQLGWGTVLAAELARHPRYTAFHHLTGLLTPPATQPAAGQSVIMPASPPLPAKATLTAPQSHPSPAHRPKPTPAPAPPVNPQTMAVGSELDLRVLPAAPGANVTYTIAPQPLPANMTFDNATGELVFDPAPGQTGHFTFAVTAADGAQTTTQRIPITVVSRPRPSTEVSGQVVDGAGRPIADVPVMIGDDMTMTDRQRRFLLSDVPDNAGPLMIDGQQVDGGAYMMLMAPTADFLGHSICAGVDNVAAQPIMLPSVDLAHATDFSKVDASQTQVLTSPLLPGVSLTVAPDSAMTSDGKPFTGKIALTALPVDQLREMLPEGLQTGMLIGVDGPDLMFSTPAKLTLPNVQGLPAGATLTLMSMDMATGGFAPTGTLMVSADGKSLVTTSGGINNASCGWITYRTPGQTVPVTVCDCQTGGSNSGNPPNTGPAPNGGKPFFKTQGAPSGTGGVMDSDAGLVTGEYFQDHALVPYQSLGLAQTIDFQYSSLQADPRPIVTVDPSVQPETQTPIDQVTASLSVGGVNQGAPVTLTNPSVGDGQYYRVPYQADATGLATGIYPYDMTVTQQYGTEPMISTSAHVTGTLDVVNAQSAPTARAGASVDCNRSTARRAGRCSSRPGRKARGSSTTPRAARSTTWPSSIPAATSRR